jgi:predicted amidohydrolase YtcJ
LNGLLIRRAELPDQRTLDVRVRDDRIVELGRSLQTAGERELDAEGGALIQGLNDHHIHLMALAAALESVPCGPPQVRDTDTLRDSLQRAARRGDPEQPWIRGIGYHESVAGELDRRRLDQLFAGTPLRIQHRSGALWMLNSAALDRLALDPSTLPPGVERDESGRPNGRFFRLDAWLRDRMGDCMGGRPPPDLASVGRLLAERGVTGASDATPTNGADECALLQDAVAAGALSIQLLVMGQHDLPTPVHAAVQLGAVKLMLDEERLPDYALLRTAIERAHGEGRPVAIHCVTRAELVLAASALGEAGPYDGDRIEHASVAPPDLVDLLRSLHVSVVTQPNFIRERGDIYRKEVEPADQAWLYRCRGFLEAGIPLAAGTDAPFGAPDPWRAMQAAIDRRPESGPPMGPSESLTPEEALALFTSPLNAPGSPTPPIAEGSHANLCLLTRPWKSARGELDHSLVHATIHNGTLSYTRSV